MKLEGKVAIVTGTSSNIGAGLAEGLGDAGASIVCIDARAENASDCATELKSRGAKALAITCDVTNEEQVKSAVAKTREEFGGVDILINGAAIFNHKGVLAMSLEEWQRQISIILTGTFLFTKYVAQQMIDSKRRGNIINIISTAGHQGEPDNIAYCTAKSGLLNFTRSAAMELIAHGIRVNSLTPTATDPEEGIERSARWGKPVRNAERIKQAFDGFRKLSPMQKLPSPRDYAKAAVFLASDDAEMITGMDLRIDAGTIARYWAWDPSSNKK
jgi:NAD(P)-dependent dehydrogenase (short-subunit alcohol dehydrogenase family)